MFRICINAYEVSNIIVIKLIPIFYEYIYKFGQFY